MIGYADPNPVTRDALAQLLDAVQRAQLVNSRAPRGLARAEVSDWLGHLRDELTEYLGYVSPDDEHHPTTG